MVLGDGPNFRLEVYPRRCTLAWISHVSSRVGEAASIYSVGV